MKIYLYLPKRILCFSLPKEVLGSYSFDENLNEESKLVNIEARNNEWVIYSTVDSQIIINGNPISDIKLELNSFYTIQRNNQKYLIYTAKLFEDDLSLYSHDNELSLIIGNGSNCNISYSCDMVAGQVCHVHYDNGVLVADMANNVSAYINNNIVNAPKISIMTGDIFELYGLKIMFLYNMLIVNNPKGRVSINLQSAHIRTFNIPQDREPVDVVIKDKDLYDKDDFFSKSPRIRRFVETKKVELSPPPKKNENEELPLIMTIGPMLTMGITSIVTIGNTINKISLKETTWKDSWTSLVTSGVMLVSTLLWPIVTQMYNKRMKVKKEKELVQKYGKYLEEKKQELSKEVNIQRDILLENLISVEDCVKIIQKRGMNFWDKRVDQNDFLVVRIGKGREKLNVEVEYPKEGFTIDEDKLRKQADAMVEEYKYIDDVPLGYSLYENKITAVMGSNLKNINFVNNILLQLITFYSYEDLNLVVFTNDVNAYCWNYIKYLNHNFTSDREIRFFSTNNETLKTVGDYLNNVFTKRLESLDETKEANAEFKPYYVVITDDYEQIKRHDFIKNITEIDKNLGFSMLILEDRLSRLPSKCNSFITLGQLQSGILKNSYDKQEQIVFNDEVNASINMMAVAKILSNIPIATEASAKSLPESITFLAMEKVGKVEQLNILNRWHTNDSTRSLKAEVGVDENGDYMYLDLHEKYHGPHGLIAGTTGSGKSEFIITYILSMAINYSPDDVAFILIDYKGGGLALAFENKKTGVSLPHLAGTITNLDKAEMDRTLVSIDSEVKRRQQMFNEARDLLGESTIDIYKYQSFYKEGKLSEPIPHLFIICDEFAELKSQQPEFMDNLISVARIGRSLGVHLILATQKPSGVVNDQIWSNSKFKVCLKVQDEADSKEMLKRPEAASLKQAGRFYLQVGYDEYFALGQSGWCGAKYYPSEKIVKTVDKSVNFINDSGTQIKSMQESNNVKIEAQGEQIAAIMNSIVQIANQLLKKAKRLWLDNIPDIILVDNLIQKYNIVQQPYDVEAIIGEYDAPEKQEQGLVKYNYLEDGNTVIYGTDGAEREMFINALIYSTALKHTAAEINYYLIDYGSESLRRFKNLPHIGGMVFLGEDESYNNLFKLIREEIDKRKKLFADYGGSYGSYIRNSNDKLPIIAIIMNNYDSIFEANQNLYDTLPELVRDSERYGIVYILTATAINSVSGKVSQNFSTNFAFRMKDSSDYMSVFGVRSKLVPRDMFGRGLLNNDGMHEFQTASIVDDFDKLNFYISNFIQLQNQTSQVTAKRIPVLPSIVRLADIQGEISSLRSIPVGINTQTLEICKLDFVSNIGSIISSNKLINTKKFVSSLVYIFSLFKNSNLFIIDSLKLLSLDNNMVPNYYNSNFEDIIKKLNEYIGELIDKNSTNEGIIILYGVDKLISKLEDKNILDDLVKTMKNYEKIGIVLIEESNKIKSYAYDSWFTTLMGNNEGIWIGRGVSEQSILKISTYNKELSKEIKNDMGYYVTDGQPTKIKLIDFISKDEDDNDGK